MGMKILWSNRGSTAKIAKKEGEGGAGALGWLPFPTYLDLFLGEAPIL